MPQAAKVPFEIIAYLIIQSMQMTITIMLQYYLRVQILHSLLKAGIIDRIPRDMKKIPLPDPSPFFSKN